jgi:Bacterial TSP3 repeat
MDQHASPTTRSERLRLLAAVAATVSTALLVACGGGSSSSGGGTTPPPPPPPPPPPASRCIDPTPAATSTVKFATPVGAAASSVEVSSNGLSACFLGTAQAGARSDVAVALDAGSFYYFEATRSQAADVVLGLSATAATEPPAGGFVPRADTLVVSGSELLTKDSAGTVVTNPAGAGNVFGFAVDLRSGYPAVSVIAPASVNPGACTGLAAAAPCIIYRWQSAAPAAALSIYAWGKGDGTNGPRVSINTGSDQLARPYTYATGAVLSLLRAKRLQGAVGFNPQWPAASGPASLPTLTPGGGDRAVVRLDDTQTITLTPANTAAGAITWKDEGGIERGTGTTMAVNAALMAALGGVGEHVLTASVVNPQNGRYGETRIRLLVKDRGKNDDDDGDGLLYDDEKRLNLNPGNADTDGDGLSDGAEVALGKNPLVADNTDAPAGAPLRGAMVREVGTSPGVVVGDDGLSVTFTDELNPACVAHVAPFDDPVYSSSAIGPEERCRKRAIRANVGIAPGEFRYFETQRLDAALNFGHGLTALDAQIDPICCFIDPPNPPSAGDPDYASYTPNGLYPNAAPSLAVNSIGGVFRRLQQIDAGFDTPFNLDKTRYYGFAVDYTGSEPKVYVVMTDTSGAMTVSQAVAGLGFAANAKVIPMLYGHPDAPTVPSSRVNLGLQKFHYDLTAVRVEVKARGADDTKLVPGVGAHRWK